MRDEHFYGAAAGADLEDGMHYERSPMYHMIVLERLLDVLNFAKANDDGLVELLTTYARKMTCLAMNWSGLESPHDARHMELRFPWHPCRVFQSPSRRRQTAASANSIWISVASTWGPQSFCQRRRNCPILSASPCPR